MKSNLEILESKYESILKNQDRGDDISYYTGAMLLLGGLLVITLLGIFIKDNYSVRLLVFIAILLISLISYKSKIAKTTANDLSAPSIEDDIQSNLKHKLELLNANLGSRKARVSAVRWFYTINFPIFLFSIKEFISGPLSNKFLIWSILITFLLGLLVWKLFFMKDLGRINENQRTVRQMISELI